MKIKRIITEQAELTDKETEILSKAKQYCHSQFDCCNCIFNKDETGCVMTEIWANLKKVNVSYEDIK